MLQRNTLCSNMGLSVVREWVNDQRGCSHFVGTAWWLIQPLVLLQIVQNFLIVDSRIWKSSCINQSFCKESREYMSKDMGEWYHTGSGTKGLPHNTANKQMLEVMNTVSYYQPQPPTTVRVVGMEAEGMIEWDLYDVDHAVSPYSININPYHL